MRVLFFDIDGVLNDHTWNEIAQSNTIMPRCVEEFNRIIHETGCKLVISSAWRYMVAGHAVTLGGFSYLLRTHGVTAKGEIVGMTVPDEEIADRADQITDWVNNHLDVAEWVAIDDLDLPLPYDNFVKTDGKVGLTADDADEIIKRFNGN